MGMGQYFQGLDDRLVAQARNRETYARENAIANIRDGYGKNMQGPGVQQAVQYQQALSGGITDEQALQAAAAAQREYSVQNGGGWRTPIESVNHAMANDAAARYGYGAAAVGGATLGGAGMTAGAQKLMDLMGLFEEAEETEVARDQPLTS